jgi:hypothetical protein
VTAFEGKLCRRICDYLRSFDVPHLWASCSRLSEPATWIRERTFEVGGGQTPVPPAVEAGSGAVGGNTGPEPVRRSTSALRRRSPGHVPLPGPFYEPEGCGDVGLHMTDPSDFMIDPPLRIRGRPDLVIDSLDQAVAFIRPYDAKTADPTTRGVLFRLERASNSTEAKDAADAFRWWLEQNHLLEIPEGRG